MDYHNDDRAPLLFVSGSEDHIMPPAIQQSNMKHYKSDTITEIREYEGYAHLLPAQKGWEEIADDVLAWAVEHACAVILTHIGGPTLLIEVAGWRLLTDPTFDPAGGHYAFGWGTSSDKVTGPALDLADLPPIDAVLLTHDHHGDNLDTAGRRCCPRSADGLTTVAGARRLTGRPDVRGLAAGDVTRLDGARQADLEVTATPARHGPPLSRPIVGDVVGFAIRAAGRAPGAGVGHRRHGALRRRCARPRRRMSVDVLVVHVGGVRFPDHRAAALHDDRTARLELVDLVSPRVAVPVHYEGWAHFKDGRAGIDRALAAAPEATRSRVRWLELGRRPTSPDRTR